MNTQNVAEKLVQLCRQGKSKEAKQELYAENIVSIEANGDKAEGLQAIFEKSKKWGEQIEQIHEAFVSDPIVAADHFAVNMRMDITYKGGYRAVMDEICVYHVKTGKIQFEQFFFNS
jgi:hypothetical protein